MSGPRLSTLVVSWRSADDVRAVVASFPSAPEHELLVVDNAGELDDRIERPGIRLLSAGRNLGFAGGCNLAAAQARAELLFFLNPDTQPAGAAYDRLLDGFAALPEADGLVPRLVGRDGQSQCAWQLRSLPRPVELLAHAFFWSPVRGARLEPPSGTPIEQPAAAALAVRRAVFDEVGGFDERFHPAWFEDVDLARRLAERGGRLRYWPQAEFVHGGGGSVAPLGYGPFLAAYDRNLALYLRLHHGAGWERLFRMLVPLGALARLAALPLRKPVRARSRRQAARALLDLARGAWTGWRLPAGAA